jgi:hypothetical protein
MVIFSGGMGADSSDGLRATPAPGRARTVTLSGAMSAVACSWCGSSVDPDEGYRAVLPGRARRAAFCRLDHVVPWALDGARWEPGSPLARDDQGRGLGSCVRCGGALPDDRLLLIRHGGRHRIADAFCGVEHLVEWARSGGRWRTAT